MRCQRTQAAARRVSHVGIGSRRLRSAQQLQRFLQARWRWARCLLRSLRTPVDSRQEYFSRRRCYRRTPRSALAETGSAGGRAFPPRAVWPFWPAGIAPRPKRRTRHPHTLGAMRAHEWQEMRIRRPAVADTGYSPSVSSDALPPAAVVLMRQRAFAGKAQQVMRAAGLGPGAGQALAAERLHADHRTDLVAVDVAVADAGVGLTMYSTVSSMRLCTPSVRP